MNTVTAQPGSLISPQVKEHLPMASLINFYPVLVLVSAFLLFQTELILAKYILPWFGGAPAAWNTCMLFFQLVLLAGYGYSDWIARHHSRQRQGRLHLLLLALALGPLFGRLLGGGAPLPPHVG